jgi:hypothetical protein
MTVKHVVIPLEVEYLQEAANRRGVSRTKLVQILMERIVRDELVSVIVGDDDLSRASQPQERYRRFRRPY